LTLDPTPRPESTGPGLSLPLLQMYVSSVLDVIRGMLQVFYMDIAKVDRDVAYVASVSEACCKRLFKMFHLVASFFYLDIAHVSQICCSMFEMFQLF
jgi:energy-converting hydrogenase Eha subunit C